MTVRALILDFDGLFIDTETTAMQAWQELYAQYGQELPFEKWLTVIGTYDAEFNAADYLDSLLGAEGPLDWDVVAPARLERELALARELPMLPGVAELLDQADELGLAMAVASSSSRAWVEGHLERLGVLGRFRALACRDDVARTKPDPALYLLAAERLGVPARDCLAFEDSLNGLLAAHAAGMPVVIVPSPLTQGFDFGEAEVVLESLAELELGELLERVGAAGS